MRERSASRSRGRSEKEGGNDYCSVWVETTIVPSEELKMETTIVPSGGFDDGNENCSVWGFRRWKRALFHPRSAKMETIIVPSGSVKMETIIVPSGLSRMETTVVPSGEL